MPLNIRKLQENDKELFLSFLNSFYHSEAVLHPTDSYLLCFVFELEGEAVGYALLSKCFCPEVGGSIIWIEQLYINEAYRGKGVAGEFLSFIEKEFGPDRIRLEVEEENEKAISLYKKNGYRFLPYLQMVKDKQ